ncbi:ankyrin protein/unc44 [Fusarium bulbicola]|nr:ankyrin protein/unc44 [Fusarium bulbicola]
MSTFVANVTEVQRASRRLEPSVDNYKRNLASYNIVVVHGIAKFSNQNETWTIDKEGANVSWVENLLPAYCNCSSIVEFDYTTKNIDRGINVQDLKSLAKNLLEGLHIKIDNSDPIVFLCHDFGGLIVKEALSMAFMSWKYLGISSRTGLLIFFGTPHRASESVTWETIAAWLLLINKRDLVYNQTWILQTTEMLKHAAASFNSLNRIYQVINVFCKRATQNPDVGVGHKIWQELNEYSATLGTPEEFKEPRDEQHHSSLCKFLEESDPLFQRVCEKINRSRALPPHYIQCIKALLEIASEHTPCFDGFNSNPNELVQYRADTSFQSWLNASRGTLNIRGGLGIKALLSLIQKDPTRHEDVITFDIGPKSPIQDSSSPLIASLCHQLLCLRPRLFCLVETAYTSLLGANEWSIGRLLAFLRALLGCRDQNPTICLIRGIENLSSHERILKDLIGASNDESLHFKLLLTADPTDGDVSKMEYSKIETSIIAPAQYNFRDVVQSEISALMALRPEVSAIREEMERFLLSKHESNLPIPYCSSVSTVRASLRLLLEISDPITRSSIRSSEHHIPRGLNDIYRKILRNVEPKSQHAALNALCWSFLAFRPLTLSELCVAVSLGKANTTKNSLGDEIPVDLEWDINAAFGDLVHLKQGQILCLQEPFREFVLDPLSGLKGDNHVAIARKCLKYISLWSSEKDEDQSLGSHSDYALLEYAVRHWPNHFNQGRCDLISGTETGVSCPPEFATFFEDFKFVQTWAGQYFQYHEQRQRSCRLDNDTLSIAVHVGCEDLVKKLLDMSPSAESLSLGLEVAIDRGHEPLINLLKTYRSESRYFLHRLASLGTSHLLKEFGDGEELDIENDCGLTLLHCACEGGDVSTVSYLLGQGLDPNIKNKDGGITPLQIACQFGHAQIIESLLKKDVDPNGADEYGLTPLHLATKWQQPTSVRSLLGGPEDKTIDITAADHNSVTALHLAAGNGREDIVTMITDYGKNLLCSDDWERRIRSLLEKRDHSDSTFLHLASGRGHLDVIRKLLQLVEDHDKEKLLLRHNKDGYIPIHLAIQFGQTDIVQHLLSLDGKYYHQLNKRVDDRDWALPIHLASLGGRLDVAKILCQAHKKAEISLNVFYGRMSSPLHIAIFNGQLAMVKLLLDNGAAANIVDYDNSSPLLLASRGGYAQIVHLLLKKGADPNTENDDKMVPLLEAAKAGHGRVVELLLKNGADRTVTDTEKRHTLHLAAEAGDLSTMQLLLEKYFQKKDDLRHLDNSGRTPLHSAMTSKNPGSSGSLAVIRMLLRHGASLTNKDNSGKSPLELAQNQAAVDVIFKSIQSDTTPESNSFRYDLLKHCVKNGYLEILEQLISESCFENMDAKELRLYHLATNSRSDRGDVIDFLVNHSIPGFDLKDDDGQTPVFQAACNGHRQAVEALVKLSPGSLNSMDRKGRTPLSYAAEMGHFPVVEYLLNKEEVSIELDGRDTSGRSPLLYAVKGNSTDIARALLKRKVDVNSHDEDQFTALHWAAEGGYHQFIDLLASSGATGSHKDKRGRTPIFIAAYFGHEAVVSKLIDCGLADKSTDDFGWTLLHASYDNHEILNLVLKKVYSDVHATTSDLSTALHFAATGHPRSTELLLEHGAEPLAQDSDSVTPLHVAAMYDHNDGIVEKLIEKATGLLDVKDKDGRSALSSAVRANNIKAVKALLETKAFDINEGEEDGRALLDVAREGENIDMIHCVMSMGDTINSQSLERLLAWALKEDNEDLQDQATKFLRVRNHHNEEKARELFAHAMEKENIPLAKFLLESSPGLDIVDKHDWTLGHLIAAWQNPAERALSASVPCERPHRPLEWKDTSKSDKLALTEGNTLSVPSGEDAYDSEPAMARSDHPVCPLRRFYFEIDVISGDETFVGVGFGRRDCKPDRMPGWDDGSWGLHGDDGGLYHGSGWPRARKNEWRFGTGDLIGCCIDPIQGKAFFHINGTDIEGYIGSISGRLFPMVGLGSGSEIVANFGENTVVNPFKFPDGLTREYCLAQELL